MIVSERIEELLEERAVPALALAVVDDFELVLTTGSEGADNALFQAGSVSKPVAALVALLLVEQGLLELDRDVNHRLARWRVPGDRVVTLRDLLGHTAGLGVEFFPGYPREVARPSLEQVLDGKPPANTPPVRVEHRQGAFRYSGGGYALLQLLLEDVTGTPFAELAATAVLGPLGMVSSTFEEPLPSDLHARAASGGWYVYPEAAAAGLWTTAADLARFELGLQWALAERSGVMGATAARLMVEPRVELSPEDKGAELRELGIEPPDRFGLGLFLTGSGDSARFSHLGGTAGFFCFLVGSLVDGTGAVVMAAGDPHPVLFEALLAIADERGWGGFRCEEAA